MVRAWYMNYDAEKDKCLEHHKNPPQFVSMEDVLQLTKVQYLKLNMETLAEDGKLDKIKKERGYSYEDEITCSRECLPNYDDVLKRFYTEHLHKHEEIRLVLDGCGYLDIRDKNDEWIRMEIVAGDLLILPGGIYHRFTLDTKNYFKARRFFIGSPIWTPYYRPCDDMECRKNYLESLKQI